MKKKSTLQLCLVSLFSLSSLHAQLTVNMSPNQAIPGQTLTTLISTPNNVFTSGSPFINDIWLQHSSSYTIYPNFGGYWFINSGNIEEEWTIPAGAPAGGYDLNFWWMDPFPFPNPVLENVPNAFLVGGYNLSGTVFFDADSNGVMNGIEYPLSNKAVMLLPAGITQYTNSSGLFIFGVPSGSYTVKFLPPVDWVNTTVDSFNVTVTNANISGLDFGTKALIDKVDFSLAIFSVNPICLTNVKYFVTTINTGTVTLTNGAVKFVRPSNTGFVSATPVPDLVSGDTLIWYYTNLNIGEMMIDTVTLLLPGAGSNLWSSASVFGQDLSGLVSTSEQATHSQNVLCSFDPNDKAVNPPGEYAPHYTLVSDTLEYLIRFQNTGNYPATNIFIEDTLSSWLDFNSFEFIGSSHPVLISTYGNGDYLFEFNNINLPDSNSNEPGSHGYVAFRVQPLNGLPDNTLVNNTSFIYFDLNPPVATNTAFNTFVTAIPLLAAFQTSDNTLCVGDCTNYIDQSTYSPVSWDWQFEGGTPGSSTIQHPSMICYDSAGLYSVTLISCNAVGCDTLVMNNFITVFSLPSVPVILQNGTWLTSSIATTYQWSLNGNPIPGATNQSINITQTGTYSVTITDVTGCSNSNDYICTGLPPNPSLSTSDTAFCEKICINFSDESFGAPANWQWYFEGASPDTSSAQNPQSICYDTAGVYDVQLITCNQYGCDTLILNDYITVYPAPLVPSITLNGNILSSSAAITYQWLFNNSPIPGATNQSITISQSGDYQIIISDSNGCNNFADTTIIITGMEFNSSYQNISIFPNPFSDLALLIFPNPGKEQFELKIYDLLGNIVVREILWSDRLLIIGDELLEGIYMYNLESVDGTRRYNGRFVLAEAVR